VKKFAVWLLLISLVSFPGIKVNAEAKAGTSCAKLGQSKKSNGLTLICVKKGKKLIWKRQSPLVASPQINSTPTAAPSTMPLPTPSSTPAIIPSPTPSEAVAPISPSPTPSQTAKPLTFSETLWSRISNGSFPIEEKKFEISTDIPTSWQDVYEKRLGITYQAWLAVSKNISTNTSKLGKIEILTGPNTVPNYPDIKRPMELVSRALPSARNVSNLRILSLISKTLAGLMRPLSACI